MADKDPWESCVANFAKARAMIRDAQDAVLAEAQRQQAIDAIAAPKADELVAASSRVLQGRVPVNK